jgi:uncharacterized protein
MTSRYTEMNQQSRRKHVPQRTCVVCRETDAKRALTRVVRTAEEGVQVDPTGKRNGRGAYLCSQPSCWQRAVESNVLDRALRTTLTAEDRQRLSEAMKQILDARS